MRTKQNQALQELQDEMDSLKKAKSKYVPEAFRNNDEITFVYYWDILQITKTSFFFKIN